MPLIYLWHMARYKCVLIRWLILSRLDYCNSVLAGLPRCTTEPLQRVLNAAARLVLNSRLRDHVSPALHQCTGCRSLTNYVSLCHSIYPIASGQSRLPTVDLVSDTPSRGAGPDLESATSVMRDPLHGTVFHTIFIILVTLVFSSAASKLSIS